MHNIQTGFRIALVIGAGLIGSALTAYTVSQSMFVVDSSRIEKLDQIADEGMELVHLTHAVLQYPGPRSIGQWQSQSAELGKLFAALGHAPEPEVDKLVERIRTRLDVLVTLDENFLDARDKAASGRQSADIAGILAAQLFQEATQLQAALKDLRTAANTSLQQAHAQVRLRQIGIFLLFTIMGSAFGVYLSLGFRRHVLTPLRGLEQTIDALRKGGHLRAPVIRNDEIGVVAETFNQLLDEQEQDAVDLRRSEERFRALIEASAQIVWNCNARGEAVEDSPSWRHYTGQSLDQWLGDGYADAIHADDRDAVMARWQEALTKGEAIDNTYRLRHRSGEWRWNQVRAIPLRDADGSVTGWVGMNIDIHEQELAKQARDQATDEITKLNSELEQRVQERTSQLEAVNKELEAFSYSISHDLRSPLRALDGYAHVIDEEEGGHLSPDGRRMLERIRFNARKMGTLIDDVLQFSRIGRHEMKRTGVDMTTLARDVVAELQLEYPRAQAVVGEMPRVGGDVAMLRQVWENLIGNAFKYSSKTEEPRIVVGAEAAAGGPTFFVRDNGAGFDLTHAGKLFQVFQRMHSETEFPGTGAGLAIAKRIVERHGGRIWAEAQPGQGATFRFTLDSRNAV